MQHYLLPNTLYEYVDSTRAVDNRYKDYAFRRFYLAKLPMSFVRFPIGNVDELPNKFSFPVTAFRGTISISPSVIVICVILKTDVQSLMRLDLGIYIEAIGYLSMNLRLSLI